MNLTGRIPLDAGQPIHGLAQPGTQLVHIESGLCQQTRHAAAVLLEQHRHEVHGLDELVIPADGEGLGVCQRQLKFACQFVHCASDMHSRMDVQVSIEMGLGAKNINSWTPDSPRRS